MSGSTSQQRWNSLPGWEAVRFLLAGGLNTLLTFAVYQLLLFVLDANLAYALAWLAGLIFVATVYPSKVFGVSSGRRSAGLKIATSYAFTFLLGLAALELLHMVGTSPRISVIFVMILTTLVNFLLGRKITSD